MRITQREIDLSSALMERDRQCNSLIRENGILRDKLLDSLFLIEKMKESNDALVSLFAELSEGSTSSFRKDEV